MKVADIMNDSVVSISEDETVALASRLLSRHNVGSLPVVDGGGALRGMVTDRDIVLRCVATGRSPRETSVGEIMSRSLVTVNPGDEAARAGELMGTAQVRRLPVTQEGRLVGIVSLGDMARVTMLNDESGRALTKISSNLRQL